MPRVLFDRLRDPGRIATQLLTAAVCCSLVLIAPHAAAAQRHAAASIDSGTVTFVTDQTASSI